jgi:arabinofuranosyltransferase
VARLRALGATTFLCIVPLALVAALGWHRRWSSDDGFINFRIVDNLLHGLGPVYNDGERVEAYTSPLWIAVLAIADVPFRIEWAAVVLGIALTVAGLAAACRGALLLARAHAREGLGIPAGAAAFAALPPAWDFATSGLDSALAIAWIGFAWMLLAGACVRGRGHVFAAVVIGAGVLVRPDLGLFSVAFLVPLLALARPAGRRRALVLLGAAGALPVAYQVFRMGYFAALGPNTAIAKEAWLSEWSRGGAYLWDFVSPYWLWVPVAALGGLLAVEVRRRFTEGRRADALVVAAPVVAGLLHALYVVRLGGDFMHGRLLLPALFGVVLPAAVVVPGRRGLPVAACAVAVIWAIVCAATLRPGYGGDHFGARGVADEREIYRLQAKRSNPVTLEDYGATAANSDAGRLRDMAARDVYTLVVSPSGQLLLDPRPLAPLPARRDLETIAAGAFFTIGIPGAAAGRDVLIADRFGLAHPVAARFEFAPIRLAGGLVVPARNRAGHEKLMTAEWIVAQYADLSAPEARGLAAEPAVMAARRALGCGDLKRVLDAVEEPLTPGRFLDNIATAVATAGLRVPPDPVRAAAELCGD